MQKFQEKLSRRWTCSACGKENPAGNAFCEECGEAKPKADLLSALPLKKPGAATRFCEACGAKMPAKAAFCEECGAPVGGSRPEQPLVEEPDCEDPIPEGRHARKQPAIDDEPVQAPGASAWVRCPECGADVPAGSPFCEECGARVTEAPAAPAEPVYQDEDEDDSFAGGSVYVDAEPEYKETPAFEDEPEYKDEPVFEDEPEYGETPAFEEPKYNDEPKFEDEPKTTYDEKDEYAPHYGDPVQDEPAYEDPVQAREAERRKIEEERRREADAILAKRLAEERQNGGSRSLFDDDDESDPYLKDPYADRDDPRTSGNGRGKAAPPRKDPPERDPYDYDDEDDPYDEYGELKRKKGKGGKSKRRSSSSRKMPVSLIIILAVVILLIAIVVFLLVSGLGSKLIDKIFGGSDPAPAAQTVTSGSVSEFYNNGGRLEVRQYSSSHTASPMGPEALVDGDPTTAWHAGRRGDSEYVLLGFPADSSYDVSGLVIVNGDNASDDAWLSSNRASDVRVYCDGAEICRLSLKDTGEPQVFPLPETVHGKVIELYFLGYTQGEAQQPYGDVLAVSEVTLLGPDEIVPGEVTPEPTATPEPTPEATPTPEPTPEPTPTPVPTPSVGGSINIYYGMFGAPQASVSSVHPDTDPNAGVLVDGKSDTAWHSEGDGTGNVITLVTIDGRRYEVGGIAIINGDAANDGAWNSSNRIATMEVYCDGAYIGLIQLEDTPGARSYAFPQPVTGSKFELRVMAVYPGETQHLYGNSLAVSELALMDPSALPTPTPVPTPTPTPTPEPSSMPVSLYYANYGQPLVLDYSSAYKNKKSSVSVEVSCMLDGSSKTAWNTVSTEPHGEYVTLGFRDGGSYEVNGIAIMNGYYKNDEVYYGNARVRTMDVYCDDIYVATLELEDTRQERVYTFPAVTGSQFHFVITSYYSGNSWKNCAITEMYLISPDELY